MAPIETPTEKSLPDGHGEATEAHAHDNPDPHSLPDGPNPGMASDLKEKAAPHRHLHWTDHDEQQLQGLRTQGKSVSQIAKQMDRSKSVIFNHLRKNTTPPLPEMIVIVSGKGGVGKSTVATGIAQTLARHGNKVGLIDMDMESPTLSIIANAHEMIMGENSLIPEESHGVDVASIGTIITPDDPLPLGDQARANLMHQMFTSIQWGEQDYMIIDFPPGSGNDVIALQNMMDGLRLTALIITQPQDVAVASVRRTIALLKREQIPIIGIVENMSGGAFGSGGGQKLADITSIPYIGTIPMDHEIAHAADTGNAIPQKHFENITTQIERTFPYRRHNIGYAQRGRRRSQGLTEQRNRLEGDDQRVPLPKRQDNAPDNPG